MECRYCQGKREGSNPIAELPFQVPNGESFWGCRPCMLERDLWCSVHDVPHAEWNAGGHLCLACHSMSFMQLKPQADEYYRFLMESLPAANAKAIREWAEDSDNWVPWAPINSAGELVLWSLSAMALIRNQPFRQLLEHVAEKIDLEPVIPRGFPISIE